MDLILSQLCKPKSLSGQAQSITVSQMLKQPTLPVTHQRALLDAWPLTKTHPSYIFEKTDADSLIFFG